MSSITTWRRLPVEAGPSERLLAEGAALLEGLTTDPTPVMRWYRSSDTALVLGRGQRRALVRGASPAVVDRFSGGGAVLMDPGLLCLDVVLPAGHPMLDGDLGAPFTRIGRAWADALRVLGVPDVAVHQGPSTTPPRTDERSRLVAAVCYATLGRGEVTARGRKLVGLAQRRRRPGALIQCGLLRRWDPAVLLKALGADPSDVQIAGAATGLDELVSPAPTDDAIRSAVEAALSREEREA